MLSIHFYFIFIYFCGLSIFFFLFSVPFFIFERGGGGGFQGDLRGLACIAGSRN